MRGLRGILIVPAAMFQAVPPGRLAPITGTIFNRLRTMSVVGSRPKNSPPKAFAVYLEAAAGVFRVSH